MTHGTVTAASSGGPFFFWAFGLPFVAVGMYMVAGRFWVDARLRARMTYAVTNERVILRSSMTRRYGSRVPMW